MNTFIYLRVPMNTTEMLWVFIFTLVEIIVIKTDRTFMNLLYGNFEFQTSKFFRGYDYHTFWKHDYLEHFFIVCCITFLNKYSLNNFYHENELLKHCYSFYYVCFVCQFRLQNTYKF